MYNSKNIPQNSFGIIQPLACAACDLKCTGCSTGCKGKCLGACTAKCATCTASCATNCSAKLGWQSTEL